MILRCILCFGCAALLDLLASMHILALARTHMITAVLSCIIYPFAGLLYAVWCVEEKSWRRRIILAGCTGLGYSCETLIVFLLNSP